MKKTVLSLLLTIFAVADSFSQSQSITVTDFRHLETDMTAKTAGTMEKDQNGETAALIKVVTTQTGFLFDCGSIGVVKTVQKPSEIWVYVPHGVKKMTISHPTLGLLRDYYLNIPIESAETYEMLINETRKNPDNEGEFRLTVNPSTAVVTVWREGAQKKSYRSDGNGKLTIWLPYGRYYYEVRAAGYETQEASGADAEGLHC